MSTAALAVPISDEALAARVRSGLATVETMLRDAATSEDAFVTAASRHLIDAGGKRFRPTLVLLAAQFGAKPDAPEVMSAAVVVELTHLATLYHDDVMDEADMRRGKRSVNSRWDNTVAILTGDLLFARAANILAELGPEAVRIQARTFDRLVSGQIKETIGPGNGVDPLRHYVQVVSEKTGALIAAAGQFGAMFAGAPDEVARTVTSVCERIGVAFQLSDDILDVASDSAQSGKTPGTDLREGIRTLPVLHALASTEPADTRLRELLTSDLSQPERHAEALTLLRAHPAMEAAREDLRRYADEARTEIQTLPDNPARTAFEALCDFVVERTG